ncbi:phosphodiester glycosidase family protein [Streptomyces sp. NPDC051211]|uniref:phosphodiester glycosidase family protein n=1 Tax=Streptomyces sp. NPDC051211 TaxID=3154643 RepID=UPI00344E3385
MVTLRPFTGLILPLLLITLPATPAWAAGPSGGIDTDRTSRQIAPGVRLESYDRLHADRWLRIHELVVDLAAPGVRAEYLGGPGTVAESAARHPAGPGRRVVAAVNGDFFDIRRTGAPLGPGIADGRLLHSPAPRAGAAVAFGPGPAGRVLRLALAGTVTLPGGATRRLTGFNSARPPAGGIAAYTAAWAGNGSALPSGAGAEADVRNGRVIAVRQFGRGTEPPAGVTLLAGRGSAAAELAALRPGDPVRITAAPAVGSGPLPSTAVGGRERLVVDGVPQNHDGMGNNAAAPRTAVGFSEDGRQLRILSVDGRQQDSAGLTLTALGRLLHELGSYNALNLDGGGSATLLAAGSGDPVLRLENSPSDGSPRTVPNGLVLTAPAGSGRPAGYHVEAVAGATRVFPGLVRTLTATGYDDLFGPAPDARPAWWTIPGSAGWVGPEGIFHAVRPGGALVHAGRALADGALRLDVLGPLARLRAEPDRIDLAEPAEAVTFRLAGFDAQGSTAPVEGRDVRWEYDSARWQVVDDGRGGFSVTALVPQAAGVLKATVPATGATAQLAVSVGRAEHILAPLDDAVRRSGPGPADGHTGTGQLLAAQPGPMDPRPATPEEIRARPWRFAVLPAERTAAGAGLGTAAIDFVLASGPRPAGAAGPPRPAAAAPAVRPVPGTASFRHRGVRFLPLDTTRGTLQGGGLARLGALRAGLEEAARDPDTGALVLVQRYAGPDRVDRKEAAVRARWLAEFRRTSGKGAAVITLDAPEPTAGRTEGVLEFAVARGSRALVGADTFPAGEGAAQPSRDWLTVHPDTPTPPTATGATAP